MNLYRTHSSLFALLCIAILGALCGCGPQHLKARTQIPQPLVAKVPVTVGVYVPKEFAEYVHKEERWGVKWNIELGEAQTKSVKQLMESMFERIIALESVESAAASSVPVRAVLEPVVEEYSFITPRDAGSEFYAVSIRYRINVYTPDGKLSDSWEFTGYSSAPAEGLSGKGPLDVATSAAMRDAGAKLAAEFVDQEVIRNLMTPETAPAETATPAQTPPSAPETSSPAVTASSEPEKNSRVTLRLHCARGRTGEMMSNALKHGGCLCGQVRYTLEGEPLMVAVCHCTHCQKISGSAFSVVALAPLAAFTIRGELAVFPDQGDSGHHIERCFCPRCGSSIQTRSEHFAARGLTVIKAGGFDDTGWLQPKVQIFCASAQQWLPPLENIARFERAPE